MTRHRSLRLPFRNLAGALIAAVAIACGGRRPAKTPTPNGEPALKEVFAGAFLVGAALNDDQFGGKDVPAATLVKAHFNATSPENVLKWEKVHPRQGEYDFGPADRYVEFGERSRMFIVGHTLVWHQQTPRWVFEDTTTGQPVSRDTLLARLRDHIRTVVGRYRGRIKGWDVVNEAFNDDGTLRDTPWQRILGDDYIATAFRLAHEADPAAELYYNDYSMEDPGKRAATVRLVQSLKAQGIPITGVGIQEHNKMDWPSVAQIDSTIAMLAATGVKVNVTELDVDVLPRVFPNLGAEVSARALDTAGKNPYAAGLPDSVQQALARRYAEIFRVYWRHRDVIDRVTFWGVADQHSWLNDWPLRGRTSYPLLFDRQGRPKPAFDAIVKVPTEPCAAGPCTE